MGKGTRKAAERCLDTCSRSHGYKLFSECSLGHSGHAETLVTTKNKGGSSWLSDGDVAPLRLSPNAYLSYAWRRGVGWGNAKLFDRNCLHASAVHESSTAQSRRWEGDGGKGVRMPLVGWGNTK